MAPLKPLRIVVVGAGGHARVVVALLASLPGYEIVGVLDRKAGTVGERVGPARIIGEWDDLERLRSEGVEAAALALGENDERARMFERLSALQFLLPPLLHPSARVESGVAIGDGAVLAIGSIVCAEATVGRGAIVNSGAIVDHECRLGDHVHIAPGSRLAGRVQVGERTFIGIGSTVRDRITIGRDVVVGAGSVVVEDLPDGVVAYGVPARVHGPHARMV